MPDATLNFGDGFFMVPVLPWLALCQATCFCYCCVLSLSLSSVSACLGRAHLGLLPLARARALITTPAADLPDFLNTT